MLKTKTKHNLKRRGWTILVPNYEKNLHTCTCLVRFLVQFLQLATSFEFSKIFQVIYALDDLKLYTDLAYSKKIHLKEYRKMPNG